jgi:transporter family protein
MHPLAFAFALLAALLWGASPLFDRVAMRDLSPLAGLTVRVVAAAVMVAVYAAWARTWKEISVAPRSALLFLLGSAFFGAVTGQLAYYAAIRYDEASRVVPVSAAYPLITMVLAVLLLREGLTFSKVAGAVLVVAGIVLIKGFR